MLGYESGGAMTEWKYNLIFRELLGAFGITLAVILSMSVCCPRPAAAQSSVSGDDGTVATIAADEDPADNIDRPAPSADYDRPAEAAATAPAADADADGASPDSATGTTLDSGTDDQVLELPQVINPASYASASYAPASYADTAPPASAAANSSSADDADGSADPAAVVMSSPPNNLQGDTDDQSADASGEAGDVQSYVDQTNDGTSGPVVVYAAPVYVPMYPVPTQTTPLPQPYTTGLPMYSGLSNRTLPMYSGLGPVAPYRYSVNGGSRLWGSPIGQGFGMARGMMGGFSHAR
jgi:hypothetical protein